MRVRQSGRFGEHRTTDQTDDLPRRFQA